MSNNATIAITLSTSVAISGKSGIDHTGSAALRLQFGASIYARTTIPASLTATVKPLTGVIRSNGSSVLQFQGKPNRPVIWSILSGSGAITSLAPTTDDKGAAYARYDAGGFTGTVQIGVNYGS